MSVTKEFTIRVIAIAQWEKRRGQ